MDDNLSTTANRDFTADGLQCIGYESRPLVYSLRVDRTSSRRPARTQSPKPLPFMLKDRSATLKQK